MPILPSGPGIFGSTVDPNALPNHQLLGATVGTIGSGGVLPTGWSLTAADGLTVGVVGFGIADPTFGLPYIDLSFSGTTNSTVITFNITVAKGFPVNPASQWSVGWSLALISGANTNITGWFYQLNAMNSSGTFIATSTSSSHATPGAALTRATAIATTPDLTAFGQPVIQFTTNNAASVTATYRIAGLSVNQGIIQPFGSQYLIRGARPPIPPTRRPILPPIIGDRTGNVAVYPDYYGLVLLAGSVPQIDQAFLPGAGSIVFTGAIPTVTNGAGGGTSVAPGVGSVVFTGQVPSVDLNLLPGAGSVVFTGFAPLGGIEATPAAGSAVFTGFLPDVEGVNPSLEPSRQPVRSPGRGPRPLIPRLPVDRSGNVAVYPDYYGSVVLTGQTPRVDTNLLPSVGSVVFTGLAPSVDTSLLPGAGSVLFTGQAPRVDDTLLPGAGSVVVTGFAPLGGIGAAPGAGAVTFTGFAPLVGIGVAPGAGSIVFTGLSPSADEALLPAVGSVVFTGLVPVVDNQSAGGQTVTPDVGSLTFTGYAPIVPDNVFPSQGNIVFSGYPPDLEQIFAPVFRGGLDDDRRYHDLDRRRRDEDDLEVLLLVTV